MMYYVIFSRICALLMYRKSDYADVAGNVPKQISDLPPVLPDSARLMGYMPWQLIGVNLCQLIATPSL